MLTHWSYVFLALTHRCTLRHFNDGYIVCNGLISTQNDGWRYRKRHFSYTSMIPLVFVINILCDFLSPIWQWNTVDVVNFIVGNIYGLIWIIDDSLSNQRWLNPSAHVDMFNKYIYMFNIYMVHIYSVYICIYIYIERERAREREKETQIDLETIHRKHCVSNKPCVNYMVPVLPDRRNVTSHRRCPLHAAGLPKARLNRRVYTEILHIITTYKCFIIGDSL